MFSISAFINHCARDPRQYIKARQRNQDIMIEKKETINKMTQLLSVENAKKSTKTTGIISG